jgi:hypothetical protein
VGGKADYHLIPKQAPCSLNWEILLPEVDAIRIDRKGDVNTIIYYDLNAVTPRN